MVRLPENLLLKNGKFLDLNGDFTTKDLRIEHGIVVQVEIGLTNSKDESVRDLREGLVVSGLVDMHVHLRVPGGEHKETLESGIAAAKRGGFTTIACMPNTNPVIDNLGQIKSLEKKIEKIGGINVIIIPAMTIKLNGKQPTSFQQFKQNGIIAVSDDGFGIADDTVMKRIFIEAKANGLSVLQHTEFSKIADGGVFNTGDLSSKFGVPGIPAEAEYKMIERDLKLLNKIGGHYHVLHLSSKKSVSLIREAKADGLNVTAEVTPHHLILSDQDILSLSSPDTNFKMNPPLRTVNDRDSLVQAVCDGTIDIIATDHAPHSVEEKSRGLLESPFGISGLETAFPLLYTHLVLSGKMELKKLVAAMSLYPSQIFNLPSNGIEKGMVANMTVIDLEIEKKVDKSRFASKGRNTPFDGWPLKGWPVFTICQGEIN